MNKWLQLLQCMQNISEHNLEGRKKNKIKECAISLNHKEEGEDTAELGDCSYFVSLKPALCEQPLPILLVVMTNVKLPEQQWLKT